MAIRFTMKACAAVASSALVATLLSGAIADARSPEVMAKSAHPIDPRSLSRNMAGPPTQVLVLGTDHLSHMPANYRSEFLGPVLDRLARYRPTIITIEQLPGAECDQLKRYKAVIPSVAVDYCQMVTSAEKATGLSVPDATSEVARTLAAWPTMPTAAQRRRLAALFLAADDRSSAAVQWLRLPSAERREGDGVDAALLDLLTRTLASRNENIAIAATLAARIGLERVYPIDDHSADQIIASQEPGYDRTMQAIWSAPTALRRDFNRREQALDSGARVLSFYRWINDHAVDAAFVRADMGAAMQSATPELYGRQYVGWWETRNLRMVANIRQAYANHPGARVLSIVGSTHKPYFERYLGMMSDAEVIDTATVLGRD